MPFMLAGAEHNTTIADNSTWRLIWDNFGYDFIVILYYICLIILVFSVIALLLRACGFANIGIVRGSYAAGYQSRHNIVKGSCFSSLQSLAMQLTRILILSAIISGLLLFACIKIRAMFETTTPQNCTSTASEQNWTESSVSMNFSEDSTVDTTTFFSEVTAFGLLTLNDSAVTSFEGISRSLAFEVNGTLDDGSTNVALGLQSAVQLMLLSLMMLYFRA